MQPFVCIEDTAPELKHMINALSEPKNEYLNSSAFLGLRVE